MKKIQYIEFSLREFEQNHQVLTELIKVLTKNKGTDLRKELGLARKNKISNAIYASLSNGKSASIPAQLQTQGKHNKLDCVPHKKYSYILDWVPWGHWV